MKIIGIISRKWNKKKRLEKMHSSDGYHSRNGSYAKFTAIIYVVIYWTG